MKASDKINILNVVPCLRDHISLYIKEDNKARLGIRRFKNKWFHEHFMLKRLPREISVNFDAYGTEVLKLIDGVRTVQSIVADFPDKETPDYEERIIRFIRQLEKDKLIDYLIKIG